MPRQVNKTVTTDAAGHQIQTKTIHKDKPRKTVDKVIRKDLSAPAGSKSKTKTKTVTKK